MVRTRVGFLKLFVQMGIGLRFFVASSLGFGFAIHVRLPVAYPPNQDRIRDMGLSLHNTHICTGRLTGTHEHIQHLSTLTK